jgi:hypothetical protein
MKSFEEFINDIGYSYSDFDRCYEMDNIINNYTEYVKTETLKTIPKYILQDVIVDFCTQSGLNSNGETYASMAKKYLNK